MLQGSNLLFNCCVITLFRLSWLLVLIIRKMVCHQSHPTTLKEVRPKRALLRSYPTMWGTLQPYPAFLLLLHDGKNGIEVLGQFISCADASTRTNLFSDFCCEHRWYISWCISITFSQCICSRDGAWWLHKEMLWGDSHQRCTKRPKCATSDLDALQETSMGWYKKMRANTLWICPSGVMKEALQNKMSCWIRVGSAGPKWEGLEEHICILPACHLPPVPDSDIRPAPPLHFCSREPFKGGRVATSMKSAQLSWRLPSTHNTLWVNGALQAPSLLPAAGQFRPQLKQDTRRHCNVRAGADRMVAQWLSFSLPGSTIQDKQLNCLQWLFQARKLPDKRATSS